jgi:hypothetical protein
MFCIILINQPINPGEAVCAVFFRVEDSELDGVRIPSWKAKLERLNDGAIRLPFVDQPHFMLCGAARRFRAYKRTACQRC